MMKKMILMLAGVGILFGGIFGYKMFMNIMMMKYMMAAGSPPVTVSSAKAELQPWQSELKAVGTLRAVQGVDITTEVPGMVEGVYFKSGDEIQTGKILVRLNADTDIAQLRSLEATASLARTVYERDKKQYEIQAVSKATLDADAAELKSRRAQVAQQAAAIGKKIIRAPFSGRLGISSVNVGQYLNPGEKIVTLQALDPMYVDFNLPQQEVSKLSVSQEVDVTSDSFPGKTFNGKISAIDPKVDPVTRNVRVQATVANPKHELLPGMFCSVAVQSGGSSFYLTLPQAAVIFNPYGETVYIVEEEKSSDGKTVLKARQKFITVGQTRGDQIAILKGLKEGDMIVTSGQMKLKNGSVLLINNAIQPANESAPKPVDQ